MNTLELDIVSPIVYANPALLHERYERYRKDAPVAWIEQEPYRPFWALTRHADIVEIEKQNTLFINEPRQNLVPRQVEDAPPAPRRNHLSWSVQLGKAPCPSM